MDTPTDHAGTVSALLGASAALAGLVLVFLGLVVGAYGGLAGDTPKAVKEPLRRTGRAVLVPFGLALACMTTATLWLAVSGRAEGLYVATVVLFIAQVVALAAAALWTLRELLWD